MIRIELLSVIILLSLVTQKTCGQPIIIKYVVEKDKSIHSTHMQSDYCTKIVSNNWDHLDLTGTQVLPSERQLILNEPDKEVTIVKYDLSRSGAYVIMDLFGHEVFLDQSMSGDTVALKLNLPYKPPYNVNSVGEAMRLNDSVMSTKFYVIKYPPKYEYMGFFDSIAYLHGDLHGGGGGYSFKELNHNLTPYLSAVKKAYTDRLRFYSVFVKKYYMPAKMRYYAFKEIQYCYYNDLLEPLTQWDAGLFKDYPKSLQDSIRQIGKDMNNDDLFENAPFYRAVVLDYLSSGFGTGVLKSSRDEFDQAYFNSELLYCGQNLKSYVQGYALTWFMQKFTDANDKTNFLKFYNAYNFNTSAPGVNHLVDSLYKLATNPSEISSAEMLDFSFEDKEHQYRKLGDLAVKDIVLIDCWATWCIPCRNQMPALDSLIDEYKDRVTFLSISADQFTPKWDDWLRKYPAKTALVQLHATDGFQNVFFRRFAVNAIPRYILISKSGKLLNAAMPYPLDKVAFENELKKYL
jgi:thiol-disulfide isomerase/thioredoxin